MTTSPKLEGRYHHTRASITPPEHRAVLQPPKRLWRWLSTLKSFVARVYSEIIEDCPLKEAPCEYDCREPNCTRERHRTCQHRIVMTMALEADAREPTK